ncbi:DEAD/DEAH box helicase [candidate division WOR-3 bacterium]|nr:DEAD/DEAH box helicase [candidate division WOR-3 bacterium]
MNLAKQVEERYRRYLETTFYFKDPDLRKSFQEALSMGHLSKGPYLEATPVFKRGNRTRELFRELFTNPPDEGFLKAVTVPGNIPLYVHQEEAILKVFGEAHNVVVATGTASGKTETFLYPILLHLYREFQTGQLGPGVRALILYPMNALANDQRDKLGEISKQLQEAGSPFRFTFGQYIGETPEDENDSRRHARDHITNRLPGELVLRREIRDNPPKILLTNYSMLEYLLIRPDDSPLFDNGRAKWWTFLVLDEAHQYRGSKGIEMGMLLRRLKRRLREGSCTEPFRCIATSATIAGGESDKDAVANFASELFGEEFLEEDVILGKTESIPDFGTTSLSLKNYRALRQTLNSSSTPDFNEIALRLELAIPESSDVAKKVGYILQRDQRSTKLRKEITTAPREVGELADKVFPDLPEKERVGALSELVELLIRERDPSSNAPLLSARYHLFLRSLEGAFVSYLPQKRLFLERRSQFEEGATFEVALCQECGQHYLVGRFRDGALQEAIRDPGHPDFGATFFRPIEKAVDETDREEGDGAKRKIFRLCIECSAMVQVNRKQSELVCGHTNSILIEQQEGAKEREDQVPRCSACGYRGPDPVREVVHGTDGPHAVIATTLFQRLPQKRKKVLAFADGRQQAAFFAWYLENSYKDILSRNLVLKIARSFSKYPVDGISLDTLADKAFHDYRDSFKEKESDDEPKIRKNIWRALYREFLTDEPRISLEGVGLLRWYIKWPEKLKIPDIFFSPPWSLNEKETRELIFILLDFMRADRAVELRTAGDVSLTWKDLGIQASQMRVRSIEKGKLRWGERKWSGKTGKRAQFLTQLLTKKGLTEQRAIEKATEALIYVWEAFRQCDESRLSQHRFLLSIDDARRLNPDWWRVFPILNDDVLYQCDTCARLQSIYVGSACTRHRCPGSVQEIRSKELEANHYRLLYKDNLPGVLRVEEHTAQIDKEKAREFQREFKAGKIHVLSSSTTFELGVDLGDLDIIFLRNVPPEAFNYAQRVGRAGRRSGFPGFAITFCRRNPHDLYHYTKPDERILKGTVRPPVISIRNEKIITRHIAAMALSYFFRDRHFRDRFQNVEKLFGDLENPSGASEFSNFLQRHKTELEKSLRGIVPPAMINEVGLNDGGWVEHIVGDSRRFALAEAEVSSDFQAVKKLERESAARRDYRTADWANRRAETIASEDTLSFLSRKVIIPKYGFPVDIVELDPHRTQQTSESLEVLLQRDLSIAIAEFAPTSKLVANKKEWTSYGVKKVAEREWRRKFYRRCSKHNLFLSWSPGQVEPSEMCCSSAVNGQYLVPQFGFVTNRQKPKEPRGRSPRVFTTRPYFMNLTGPEPGDLDFGVVRLTKASPGLMVVLCEGRRGRGFYICGQCGAGFREHKNQHETPYGENCSGTLEHVSLGHEFETDVLQLRFLLGLPQNDIDGIWFAYSLAYALVEGAAEVLEVPSIDLSTTVAYSSDSAFPPIILYDNVPGGAGLVARLEEKEILRVCLEAALVRVNGSCGCGENDSCYGCLRSYRNQFAHQYLRRGPVMHYLKTLLEEWKNNVSGSATNMSL